MSAILIPSEIDFVTPMRHQWEFPNAVTIFTVAHSAATNTTLWDLYTQVIDDYSYQWEFHVRHRYEPGDSKDLFHEFSLYRHPGWRKKERISSKVAEAFSKKYIQRLQQYPILLFNPKGAAAGNKGFVHMAYDIMLNDYFGLKLFD